MSAVTIFFKPLPLLPQHWLQVATATGASFSKSRNRFSLLQDSSTATTISIPKQGQRKREDRGTASPQIENVGGQTYNFTIPESRKSRKETVLLGSYRHFSALLTLTRTPLALQIFHHLLGGGGSNTSNTPRLSRLLLVVEKNEKKRSKARQK